MRNCDDLNMLIPSYTFEVLSSNHFSLSLSLAGLAPRRLTETSFTADSNGIHRKSRTDKHEIRTVRGNVCKSSARAGKGTWYNCKSSAGAGKGKGCKCKDAPKADTGYSEEVCRRFTQKRVGSSGRL